MRRLKATALACIVFHVVACARPPRPPLEDPTGRENFSAFTLQQVRGTRDGDRLDAEAKFGDGSSMLTVEMHFIVGAPTKLQSGRWEWNPSERPGNSHSASGTVSERSVMFLGGQSGPPSLGGRFDLLNATGTAEYRITIPTTELTLKLR